MNANLFALFESHCKAHAGRVFLALPDGTSYTFASIDRLSGRFATALLDDGVRPGDRVLVQVRKSAGAVALYLATLRIGAVFVPLNTAYTDAELHYYLSDAKPGVFICEPERKTRLAAVAAETGVGRILSLGTSPDTDLWQAVDALEAFDGVVARDDDDLAALVYTSGTTGRSKGAMLTHRNLSSNALTLREYWRFEPADVLLHALPIFHIHGLFVALHCALLSAAKVLLLLHFDLDRIVAALRSEATVMMGVPTFYTRLLASTKIDAADCRSMRLFISGSAPMSEQTHRQWTERTGHRILERYGMTEAGIIASNPCDGERIPGSVGYPLPGVEVRIVDAQGNPVTDGEIGSIEVRGPNVFKGYWRMPEITAGEFRDDGFFVTGDMGTMSQDGRVSIVGRVKDLVITGGYNVYPKEIEQVLDGLDGVRESAVIGLPHPDFGEAVVAVLACRPGEEPDAASVMNRLGAELARFKQPKRIFYRDELPRNAMGKVQKNQLRDDYRDTFRHSNR